MSRSLGWTWLTTRPPISISPPVMFSRPAIMRSSVDLPQPEGPTRTQNSPSAIATSTPRTTSVEPKDLRTCLRATLAMALDGFSIGKKRCGEPQRRVSAEVLTGQVVRPKRGARVRGVENHYLVLGVSETASPEVIAIAYEGKLRALVRSGVPAAECMAEEMLL